MRTYLIVSALIFTVVAVVHLMRVMQGWMLQLGTFTVPIWMSVLALLLSGVIAFWGFSLMRKA